MPLPTPKAATLKSTATPRRFDTPPRAAPDTTTFLYDDAGLPLRTSGRTLVIVTTNPVPCTLPLPATLSVGDELTFDPQHAACWLITRIMHAIGTPQPTRHIWLKAREFV